MPVANIEIKGNPKDFLAAMEKSQRKIKEVRKDAANMQGDAKAGSNRAVAAAAAAGAAIGATVMDALVKALASAAKESKYLNSIMATFQGVESAFNLSNSIDALDDRAKNSNIPIEKLYAFESATNIVSGMKDGEGQKALQNFASGRAETLNTDGETNFGKGLQALGMTVEDLDGLDDVDALFKVLEHAKGLSDSDLIPTLENLGYSAKSIGAARNMVTNLSNITGTMDEVYSASGGREALKNNLMAGSEPAGAMEAESIKTNAHELGLLAKNKDSITRLAISEGEKARATASGVYENASKYQEAIKSVASKIDMIGDAVTTFAGNAGKIAQMAEKVIGFQGLVK